MSVSDIITAPYLPMLGPVHPDEICDKLLASLQASSNLNALLPYDKAIRWRSTPAERIEQGGILRHKDTVTITTKDQKGRRQYVYGGDTLKASNNIYKQTVISHKLRTTSCTNQVCIFLDSYEQEENISRHPNITELDITNTMLIDQLTVLGDEDSQAGFSALLGCGSGVNAKTSIMVYIQENVVLGAIGPLDTLPDSRGVRRLLPCYFGVHKAAQRRGVGAALWSAARLWARSQGAQYHILQAAYGSPAQKFYENQGLQNLGYVAHIETRASANYDPHVIS